MLSVLLNTDSLIHAQRTGIPHYTSHLLNGMICHKDIVSLYTFTGTHFRKYYPNRSLLKKNVFNKIYQMFEKIPFIEKQLVKYNTKFAESFEIFAKNLSRKTIYHEPNFVMHPYDGICVATLHDLSCLRYPQFQPAERISWFEQGLKRTMSQATHFITGSDFSRKEGIEYLGISPEKITTIYHSVSHEFRPRSNEDNIQVLQKYNLKHKKYILSVCTFEPRKNLKNLLDAYLLLPQILREEYPLILVGAMGWKTNELFDHINNNSAYVKVLGYVPDEDLPAIFSSAQIFCYLSLYEGFGLPVLEALASGVPVLTSAETSMAEFSHKQARLVNPLDIDNIVEGLKELVDDDSWVKQALLLADFYRNNFSHEICVNKTLNVYKQLI